MFNNIGKKIKTVAKVFFWIGTVLSVIGGIAVLVTAIATSSRLISYYGYGRPLVAGSSILLGILLIILGPLFAWLSNIVLYGFGELIERAASIDNKLPAPPMGQVPPQNMQGGYARPVTQPVIRPGAPVYNGNPVPSAPNNYAHPQQPAQPQQPIQNQNPTGTPPASPTGI